MFNIKHIKKMKSNITVELIYKQRMILQDEQFSYELATQVLPELFWHDLDDAYQFIEGLLMIESSINSVFSEEEKDEFELFFYINKGNVYMRRNDEHISYKAYHKTICIDNKSFQISKDGKQQLIQYFKTLKNRIYED